MMTSRTGTTMLAVGLAVAAAVPASAQSASEIVDRMLEEYADRAEGIDDYTIVQDVMGIETVSYYEKEIVDGRPVFRLRSSAAGPARLAQDDVTFDQVYQMGDELAARGRYAGVQRVDDYDLHVLEVDDLSGMGFADAMTPESDFTPRSGSLFLDVDTYIPRRFEFEGEMRNEDGVHTVSSTVSMGDIRDIDGMLVPFRTVIEIEGLGEAIDEDTRAQLEQMEAELEAMPPEQRAMVERMMSGQLEQLRSMMQGSGPMTVQVLVREVRVNEGPPTG